MNEAETLNEQTADKATQPSEPKPDATNELLLQLKNERDEYQQQVLRTMAEFQNFRKRTEGERALVRQMATEELVVQLLPVLDNFERALASADSGASLESVLEGLRLVDRQLRTALDSQRVVRIPAFGEPFDPDLHEAIATEHTDDHPDDTVVLEIEAGYKMAERVIRPSKVKVSKKKS